jgi:PAS domain S-box-containing protein
MTDKDALDHRTQDPAAPTEAGSSTHAPRPGVRALLSAPALRASLENVRVAASIGLLVVVGVVAINLMVWHNARQRIEAEAWRRLEVATDVRVADIDHVLDVTRREALSVARDPRIVSAVRSVRSHPSSAGTDPVLDELYTRAAEFEFRNVAVLDGTGTPLGEWHARSAEQAEIDHDAAREAAQSGQPAWGRPLFGRNAIAVPLGDAGGGRVIVFHGDFAHTLQPLLQRWPGFAEATGAYLVRAQGGDVELLSRPPTSTFTRPGTRIPMAAPDAMAAAMASTRVASRVEVRDETNGIVWAVTRPLQNTDWGLVAQAPRIEMLAPMASIRQALVSVDVILAFIFVGIVLVWRRSYTSAMSRREVELTERHARRLHSMLDTAFDAIFTFDRDGRVRSANRAAEAMVGQPAEVILELPIKKLLHWGEAGRGTALPQTGAVVTGEAMRPDGERIPVEFSIGRSEDGDTQVFTAIVRDVRDRVEAERRIRLSNQELEVSNRRLEEMNAQLEEASRLKSEFLANTSHELRTPLNGMIGFLQLVLDGMCESREEEIEFQKQALQCSRHLLGLINDVLDIAKIEAGKLSLDLSKLDLQQLFDEVYTLTHVQAAQKNLKLTFADETGDDAGARGDFGKVKQVLINLIGNSLKFTAKGGIDVRAKAHPELGHIVIEVLDTGIGISADRQHLVFDKFVQADGSTTRRFGGTGLGLAISKSLVELMGGIMGIRSDGENRGTTVYFSLPLWREETSAPVPQADALADRIEGSPGDPLVLVVEDDNVFRKFVTAVLQRGGYRTVEADHAESAWMLVRRLRPAVVLLDYALSCQDGAALRTGWDLAQRMASEPQTRHIPVVFVTGFDGELKHRLHSTAFARRPEHMVKPVDPATLIAKISALTDDKQGRLVRVLMADDDPTVLAYVRRVLPSDRYLVEVANNGDECLHILRTQPNGYDVLLLDLMMPEVSGYDVLREMTLSGIQPDLPVMVLTNFPEPRNDEEKRLLREGLVLDVVSKTAVHDNPQLLPHVLDWHLQVSLGDTGPPDDELRRAA